MFSPPNTKGFFLDPSPIFPDDFEMYKRTVRDYLLNAAQAINGREISIYPLNEILAGKYLYTRGNPQRFRNIYRKEFDIPPIATGATYTVAHAINNVVEFTLIQGACVTDFPDFRPIPYVSVAAVNQGIEIRPTSTNLIIINGAGAPNILKGNVTLEYVKQ